MNISYSVEISEFSGTEPVSLSELKAHLKLDTSADDTLLTALIQQARKHIEMFTGTSIVAHEITAVAKLENYHLFELPYGPFADTLTVTRMAIAGGSSQLLTSDQFEQYGDYFKQIKVYDCGMYLITYNAGYTDVPESLKLSIIHQAAYLYEHRGDEGITISPTAQLLAQNYRRVVA